jgi:hypothetical protein
MMKKAFVMICMGLLLLVISSMVSSAETPRERQNKASPAFSQDVVSQIVTIDYATIERQEEVPFVYIGYVYALNPLSTNDIIIHFLKQDTQKRTYTKILQQLNDTSLLTKNSNDIENLWGLIG